MKKILITPLDWGLGHATRCIPIIEELLKRKCVVFLAGSGDSLLLLQHEFPQLTFYSLPGYNPRYSVGRSMVWKMTIQIPKFISVIEKEHRQIESIIEENKIDLVISDNRYGCWSSKIPSIFITHQLNILMPKGFGWLSGLVRLLNKKLVKKFSACWIPDYADPELSLSGKLSRYNKSAFNSVTYIGPLSRFSPTNNHECKFDVVCVFSGPEPQRTIFEEKVVAQLRISGLRYFVVQGVVSKKSSREENRATFLNSHAIQTVISQSSLVIARSGYSTIMDLAVLGKKGILIPTPGQTEQEYLADRLAQKGAFYSVRQHKFNLAMALQELKSFTGFPALNHSQAQLTNALDQIL